MLHYRIIGRMKLLKKLIQFCQEQGSYLNYCCFLYFEEIESRNFFQNNIGYLTNLVLQIHSSFSFEDTQMIFTPV